VKTRFFRAFSVLLQFLTGENRRILKVLEKLQKLRFSGGFSPLFWRLLSRRFRNNKYINVSVFCGIQCFSNFLRSQIFVLRSV